MFTHALGFPRIGEKRELKRASESFWKGQSSAADLEAAAREIRRKNWIAQRDAGLSLIPSNDFSFYDQVLDATCLLGNIPHRFHHRKGEAVSIETYFALARGTGRETEAEACGCGSEGSKGTAACEMTKWFDTNYHYIVPEFGPDTEFQLSTTKPFDEFAEAKALGIITKPVLLGPLTYLQLGKCRAAGFDQFDLLDRLLPVYGEILRRLSDQGAEWVQIDEPALVLDMDAERQSAYFKAYKYLREAAPNLKILLATYFGELRDNRSLATALPVDALHVDVTRAAGEFDSILANLPPAMRLSIGVVDGRNIWRNNFERSLAIIEKARKALGNERVMVASSCSLLHSPVTLRHEAALDAELKSWLAFAEEKLVEIATLARLAEGKGDATALEENRRAIAGRAQSARIHRSEVAARCRGVRPNDFNRASSFEVRQKSQRNALGLPLLPTTTIGSFPQTSEVRAARAKWKRKELPDADYNAFLKQATTECVRFQEEVGIDVLVHGEFERTDMVEYFGEQLDGFTFTSNGWVQSYGSRCVKPPIIYGDVQRPKAMTVDWTVFAQSLTPRPMKGMLTGPITILQWSFVRDDQPRSETAKQIALAIRDEVVDLERAGIRVIQIDEPALREGLPLRRSDWDAYLDWAVNAFRLSAAGVRDETQIHTHMCYAEFNDIMPAIAALDADVISIETSRSNMELLDAFAAFSYPNEIGPGVYDIHSPLVPSVADIVGRMEKAIAVIPIDRLWINPDCGLKTRGWPEVRSALSNMVAAAKELRTARGGSEASCAASSSPRACS